MAWPWSSRRMGWPPGGSTKGPSARGSQRFPWRRPDEDAWGREEEEGDSCGEEVLAGRAKLVVRVALGGTVGAGAHEAQSGSRLAWREMVSSSRGTDRGLDSHTSTLPCSPGCEGNASSGGWQIIQEEH
eukprot:scaffold50976_cov20-Tisochrysis_lutea.AAC.2